MRLRTFLLLPVLLELGTLVALSMLAGLGVLLATLIGTGFLGSALLRRGPSQRVAGVLLMIPGLLTDLLGLLMLLPASRRWLARLLGTWLLRRAMAGGLLQQVPEGAAPPSHGGVPPTGKPPDGFPFPPEQPRVVEAEVLDVREAPSSRPRLE